jgi:hypothetical protein
MTMTMISSTTGSRVESIHLISKLQRGFEVIHLISKLQIGFEVINLVVISTRWSCSPLFSYTIVFLLSSEKCCWV